MRTRRSPRNQDRLFKELGGKPVEAAPVVSPVCFNCIFYKSLRSKSNCEKTGKVTLGLSSKECFTAKQ